MRLVRRALATSVAALALAAAGFVGATPAQATPEDGKGCVGSREIPETYVCVISLTPETVVPTTTTTNVPVDVPSLCYFADCTEPRTVDVPVPGVTPRSGVVVTLWYQGDTIPIGVGTVDALAVLYDTIDLATGVASDAAGAAGGLVTFAADLANGLAGAAVGIANDAADDAGTAADSAVAYAEAQVDNAGDTLDYVNGQVAGAVATVTGTVTYVRGEVDNAVDVVGEEADRQLQEIRDTVAGLPSAQEIRDALVEFVQAYLDRLDPALEDVQDTLDDVRDTIDRLTSQDLGELIQRLLDSPTMDRVRDLLASITLPCLEYSCIGPK